MSRYQGIVGPDGQSITPGGITDMAEAGRGLVLNDEVEAKLGEIFKGLEDTDIKAKFKLDIAFSEHRSVHHPFTGIVAAWTNGGFLHGGGDEVVYFCGQKIDNVIGGGQHTCATPLALMFVGKRVAVCPSCKRPSDPKALVGQVIAKLPMQRWVDLVVKMFSHLEHNADIRMGTLQGDLRAANELETQRDRGGDDFEKVRGQRAWIAYPLRNIIKDTAAGGTLSGRIRSFLYA